MKDLIAKLKAKGGQLAITLVSLLVGLQLIFGTFADLLFGLIIVAILYTIVKVD